MDKVKKNNLNRFKLLEKMYNAESLNKVISIDSLEFLEITNMTKKEKNDAILFLIEKGLACDFGNNSYSMARITTLGIEEYERLVLKPESEGNYLPDGINYININNMTNSQIQQGENNVQKIEINEKEKTEISSLINEIEKELPAFPLGDIVKQDIFTNDISIDEKISHAKRLFFKPDSTFDDKRSACETLSFILEPIREELMKIFTKSDVSDFFNIVNNFDIRHNKEKTKNIEHVEQLEWIFYSLLNSIICFYKMKST